MTDNAKKKATIGRQCPSGQDEFYAATLEWLLKQGILRRDTRMFVACGGPLDREILLHAGLQNATISTLDTQAPPDTFAPFTSSIQDVEALTLADDEFEFCVAHNGLHHCSSPHRGLLELYRVAKRGVLVFEPRDSLLTRIGVRVGFGQEFEIGAVAANGFIAGGVRDTPIPNYVYRWTEREIEKTIHSFCPWGKPTFIYRRALRVPWGRLLGLNNPVFYYLVRGLMPLLQLFLLCFPSQANGFAFLILKPRIPNDLQPWLKLQDSRIAPDKEWIQKEYHF